MRRAGYGTVLDPSSVNSLLPRAAFGHWEVVELSCRSQKPVFGESPRSGSAAASSRKRAVLFGLSLHLCISKVISQVISHLKRLTIPVFASNQVEETFPLLKEVPANYIYSTIPMGFSLSKSATQVSAMHMDSKVDDHLMRGTEKSKLEPVTQLFQNTKKIRLEDTNQEHFTRSKEIGSGSLSEKTLGSVVYVKENDGIEMTDVE
ncbi:uncharacterized protein C2orf15 homolog [Leptonychotes weddellii]|uniref:Uncharacterized protein C2orf15 homolog n=2 Tax=Monachinae TaxID=3410119 RepID=A0A7F8QX57_LEPWE|nr:uncharacterized protein C2orf15 homolog [Leptonychotes weddellii]